MPSSIGHAAAAVLMAPVLHKDERTCGVIAAGVIAATAPDVDAVRWILTGDAAALRDHRGITHSLLIAALVTVVVYGVRRAVNPGARVMTAAFLGLAVASHDLLDTMTTYGNGVALLAPFVDKRWKCPWEPLSGLGAEIVLLWLPALIVYTAWYRPRSIGDLSPRHRRRQASIGKTFSTRSLERDDDD